MGNTACGGGSKLKATEPFETKFPTDNNENSLKETAKTTILTQEHLKYLTTVREKYLENAPTQESVLSNAEDSKQFWNFLEFEDLSSIHNFMEQKDHFKGLEFDYDLVLLVCKMKRGKVLNYLLKRIFAIEGADEYEKYVNFIDSEGNFPLMLASNTEISGSPSNILLILASGGGLDTELTNHLGFTVVQMAEIYQLNAVMNYLKTNADLMEEIQEEWLQCDNLYTIANFKYKGFSNISTDIDILMYDNGNAFISYYNSLFQGRNEIFWRHVTKHLKENKLSSIPIFDDTFEAKYLPGIYTNPLIGLVVYALSFFKQYAKKIVNEIKSDCPNAVTKDYSVKLFDQESQKDVEIIVSDVFPYHYENFANYFSARELWPLLVEKALIQHFGKNNGELALKDVISAIFRTKASEGSVSQYIQMLPSIETENLFNVAISNDKKAILRIKEIKKINEDLFFHFKMLENNILPFERSEKDPSVLEQFDGINEHSIILSLEEFKTNFESVVFWKVFDYNHKLNHELGNHETHNLFQFENQETQFVAFSFCLSDESKINQIENSHVLFSLFQIEEDKIVKILRHNELYQIGTDPQNKGVYLPILLYKGTFLIKVLYTGKFNLPITMSSISEKNLPISPSEFLFEQSFANLISEKLGGIDEVSNVKKFSFKNAALTSNIGVIRVKNNASKNKRFRIEFQNVESIVLEKKNQNGPNAYDTMMKPEEEITFTYSFFENEKKSAVSWIIKY